VEEVTMTCFSGGTLDIYIEPQQPKPRLLVVGNLPVAQALVHLGKAMNYRVIAVDPESDGSALGGADQVLTRLADLRAHTNPLTSVVVATHGNYDEPALAQALASSAPYVGLVASPKRGEAVREQLRRDGVGEEKLRRLQVPAGLDIGARRGDEIALSILAEIVQARRAAEHLTWSSEMDSQMESESVGADSGEAVDCCGTESEPAVEKSCCGGAARAEPETVSETVEIETVEEADHAR